MLTRPLWASTGFANLTPDVRQTTGRTPQIVAFTAAAVHIAVAAHKHQVATVVASRRGRKPVAVASFIGTVII